MERAVRLRMTIVTKAGGIPRALTTLTGSASKDHLRTTKPDQRLITLQALKRYVRPRLTYVKFFVQSLSFAFKRQRLISNCKAVKCK